MSWRVARATRRSANPAGTFSNGVGRTVAPPGPLASGSEVLRPRNAPRQTTKGQRLAWSPLCYVRWPPP